MNKLQPVLDALTDFDLWRQSGDAVKVFLTIVAKSDDGVFKGGITRLMALIHHPLADIDKESEMHASAILKARRELVDIVGSLEVIGAVVVDTQMTWRVVELQRLEDDVAEHIRRSSAKSASAAWYKRKTEAAAKEIALMEQAIA